MNCNHTDAERAAAGCPICLRSERDALHEQLAKANDEVVSLLWAESNNEAERDRLRQALERCQAATERIWHTAAEKGDGLYVSKADVAAISDAVVKALGAKEDRT